MALNFLNDGYFAGKVGIGKPVPTKPLDVVGNAEVEGTLTVKTSSNNIRLLDSNDSSVNFSVGVNGRFQIRDVVAATNPLQIEIAAPSNSFRIKANGNVGINTGSAAAKLDVVGSGLSTMFRLSNTEANATTKYGAILGRHYTNAEENVTGMLITSSSSVTGGSVSIGGGISAANAVNNILFYTAANNTTLTGSERMRITSAGNVGIGTPSPSAKLDIRKGGNTAAQGDTDLIVQDSTAASSTAQVQILGGATGFSNLYFSDTSAYNIGGFIYNHSSNYLATNVNGSEKMRITAAGNIGVNTTSPDNISSTGTVLSISTQGALTTNSLAGSLTFLTNDASFTNTYADGVTTEISSICESTTGAAYGLSFSTSTITSSNRAERLRITATGNVGIGTTTPFAKFHVKNGNTLSSALTNTSALIEGFSQSILQIASHSSGFSQIAFGDQDDGFDGGFIYSNASRYLSIETANAERMRINSSGNVAIGTTIPSAKLHVQGSSGNSSLLLIRDTNSTLGTKLATFIQQDGTNNPNLDISSNSTGILVNTGFSTGIPGSFTLQSNGGNSYIAFNTSGANERMRIKNNGNVGIGTISPVSPLTVKSNSVSSGESGIVIQANGNTNSIIKLGERATDGARLEMLDAGVTKIALFTDGTDNYINAGNVGIGTTNPGGKLDIYYVGTGGTGTQGIGEGLNISSFTPNITFNDNSASVDNYAIHLNQSVLTLGRYTSATSQSPDLVLTAGKVGIGTVSPTEKLDISGTAIVRSTLFTVGNVHGFNPSFGASFFINNSGGTSYFNTTGGNVGIGTTSPTAKLHVAGTGLFTGLVSGITPVAAANFVTKAYVDGSGGGTGPFLPLAGGTMTGTAGVLMPDNFRLKFGDATTPDLQIYHDGSHSYINDSGVGALKILASQLEINNAANSENIATFTQDGAVSLYYDGSKRFETGSGGVEVQGNVRLKGTVPSVIFEETDVTANWRNRVSSGSYRVQYASDGTTFVDYLTLGASANTIEKETTFKGNVTVDGASITIDTDTAGSSLTWKESDSSTLAGILRGYANRGDIYLYASGVKKTELSALNDSFIPALHIGGTTAATGGVLQTTGNVNIDGSADISGNISTQDLLLPDGGDIAWAGGFGSSKPVLAANGTTIKMYPSGATSGVHFSLSPTVATFTNKVTSAQTAASDSSITLTTKSYVDGLVTGVPVYKGTWDARNIAEGGATDGGNPDLRLAANKVLGNYYIVSTAGSASPNGGTTEPNSWNVGDWCIFSDVTPGTGTDLWQKIDNTSVISGAGTGQKVTKWEGAGPSETLTDGPITFSTNDSTFAGNVTISNELTIAQDSASDRILFTRSGHDSFSLSLLGSQGLTITNVTDNRTDLQFSGSGKATFAGDVGIGITPLAPLQVKTATNLNLTVTANGSSDVRINAVNDAVDATVPLEFNATNYEFLGTGNSTFAGDIYGNDRLYLGTKMVLDVNGTDLYLGSTTNADHNDTVYIRTNNANRVTITDTSATFAGDVKIATASNQGNLFFGTADANYRIFGGGNFGYMGYNTGGYHRFLTNGTEVARINPTGVAVKTTGVTAALNVLDTNSTSVKATRIGNDTTSIYFYNTQVDAVLAWTCGSYHNAEVVITASQTNSGDYNNLYIRGIWSNNHTSHHWDELEHVGGLTGSTITMSVGQNGSTTNSGRLELDFNYTNGSFATLNVRVTDFFGTHSYTIT